MPAKRTNNYNETKKLASHDESVSHVSNVSSSSSSHEEPTTANKDVPVEQEHNTNSPATTIASLGPTPIDLTQDINTSSLSIEKVKRRKYDSDDMGKLINDLRGCVGFVDDRWAIKVLKNNQFYIKIMNEKKFIESFHNYHVIKNDSRTGIHQIIKRYSKYFMYDDMKILRDNEPQVINLFQGFAFKEIVSDDFETLDDFLERLEILDDFLKHIEEVICNNNKEKFEYFINWWASIFQNITVKLGTMPIIHGAQGSGKSFPVEVFTALLGTNALSNVDDLDKVFGKFNGLISRHLLININEPPDAGEKFKYLGKIKSKLTQVKALCETKCIDQFEIDSWANYCLTTNNYSPIQEEKGDRRLIYFETNNKYCGNAKYFHNLCSPIQKKKQGPYNPEFMGLLLNYLKTRDISKFDPESLIRKINSDVNCEYNEQLERQYADLNGVDRYVVDNWKLFNQGYPLDLIKIEGYSSRGITLKLSSVCENNYREYKKNIKHISKPELALIKGERIRLYKLKKDSDIPDLISIINYRKHQEELLEIKIKSDDTDEEIQF
jgi:hypothetical protein